MAGNQTDNLMLLDLTTGLPRTPETGGTPDVIQLSTDMQLISGANMLIDGDLQVNGTTTTIHSEQVNIRDNHLYLNADYTTVAAQTGGLVVNVLPTATNDTVAVGGFTAGVAAVSNPTVSTTGAATFSAGDIIQISGSNDGLFEVEGHAANVLTIRGIGTVSTTQDWFANQFVSDTTVAGTITLVNINVLRGNSSGDWETYTGDTTVGLTYSTFTAQGVVDLQEAYVQGNTITTSAAEGDVTITGTETLVVTTTGGLDVDTIFDFDGTSFDVQMTGTNGFSVDGTAASNVSVTAGDLTLSTITSGALIASSAANIDIDATTSMTVNTANATDASANSIAFVTGSSTAGNADGADFSITGGNGFGTGNGADISLVTGDSGAGATGAGGNLLFTGGDAASTSGIGGGATFTMGDGTGAGTAGQLQLTGPNTEAEALLRLNPTGANGEDVSIFSGSSSPNGVVTANAGSLFLRDTGAGGEVYVNTSVGNGNTWTLLSAAGGATLQSAYEAGNTITTSAVEGDITFTGTEDFVITLSDLLVDTTASISLDADAASNFTVDGGNLTLSTTTSGNVAVTSADGVSVSAGSEAAAAGNAVTIAAGAGGGANSGGAVTIDAGDSGAGATGNGANVEIGAGDALSTNGDGGLITLTVGDNAGTGTQGFVDVVGPNDEDEFLVRLTTQGTNGDSAELFVGDSDPDGSVTGLAGSLFLRDTGTSGELYINESTTQGTDWARVITDSVTRTLTLTAAATIQIGDLVALDSAGDAILADSDTGTDEDAYCIGVAATAATATNPVEVFSNSGSLVPANFGAAPGAAANGSVVFVSATGGQATLTAPTGGGNIIFKIGILQGADGVDTSPNVVIQPQFLSKRP
jgi:hypothetical protein